MNNYIYNKNNKYKHNLQQNKIVHKQLNYNFIYKTNKKKIVKIK